MEKWYSLIEKVYQVENLNAAYWSVRRNKGAPGIDGEIVEVYGESLEENIAQLHYDLKTGNYKPEPVLRVESEREGKKEKKEKRPLGIFTVRDRVVQQELLNRLQPIFDPVIHPSSYGYRKKRGKVLEFSQGLRPSCPRAASAEHENPIF